MSTEREREIRRRRKRRAKLRYLRARLERSPDLRERERLIQKIRKISPTAPIPKG
ncbi:MAG: DUF6800 family protein [Anaerolineae bacterium]